MWFMAALIGFVIVEVIVVAWWYGPKAMRDEEVKTAVEDGFAKAAEIAANKAIEKINKR